ncbi:hypothetical protein [Embleya sp. NPDC020630]|uniref:hypothetical protein n=1 Tax=Embleya sp. NPDC020630 TaxID=3363979 RepID=UPI0037B3588E
MTTESLCKENIQSVGEEPCSAVTGYRPGDCAPVMEQFREYCLAKGGAFPYPIFYCQLPDNSAKFFADVRTHKSECAKLGGEMGVCACCCGSGAQATMIALSAERQEKADSIAKGEQALTGSLTDDGTVAWAPAPVTFSDGAAGAAHLNSVHLSFGHPDDPAAELVCSTDQPILLADGTLVQASQVQVRDRLMGADGQPVPVRSVAIGEYSGGVHHLGIGRSSEPGEGHLVQAAGIVIGDYYLQLQPGLLAGHWADDAQRPHIWDDAYARDNSAEQRGVSYVFGTPGCGSETVLAEGKFSVFTGPADYTGTDVAALFTSAQANDIRTQGAQLSPGIVAPKSIVESVFSHLRGFYPDIDFHLDWDQPEPDVYAVRRHGRKIVVVTGGLARTQRGNDTATVLGFEGMVMAVGHGAERFSRTAPLNTHGFATTGAADYRAFQELAQRFWPGGSSWLANATAAERQFGALFDLVAAPNAQGSPDPAADEPSLDCRRRCIAFADTRGIPECAGGHRP